MIGIKSRKKRENLLESGMTPHFPYFCSLIVGCAITAKKLIYDRMRETKLEGGWDSFFPLVINNLF